jgi:hypothetical protein
MCLSLPRLDVCLDMLLHPMIYAARQLWLFACRDGSHESVLKKAEATGC